MFILLHINTIFSCFPPNSGGWHLDLPSDGDVPFCPKDWYHNSVNSEESLGLKFHNSNENLGHKSGHHERFPEEDNNSVKYLKIVKMIT